MMQRDEREKKRVGGGKKERLGGWRLKNTACTCSKSERERPGKTFKAR